MFQKPTDISKNILGTRTVYNLSDSAHCKAKPLNEWKESADELRQTWTNSHLEHHQSSAYYLKLVTRSHKCLLEAFSLSNGNSWHSQKLERDWEWREQNLWSPKTLSQIPANQFCDILYTNYHTQSPLGLAKFICSPARMVSIGRLFRYSHLGRNWLWKKMRILSKPHTSLILICDLYKLQLTGWLKANFHTFEHSRVAS